MFHDISIATIEPKLHLKYHDNTKNGPVGTVKVSATLSDFNASSDEMTIKIVVTNVIRMDTVTI